MKRFVTKRIIKMPRYKIIYVITLGIIILIIIVNVLVTIYLNVIDEDKLVRVLVNNSYGNILDRYSYSDNNFFYKNIYGLDFVNSVNTSILDDGFHDLMVDIKLKEPIIYIYNTFQTDKYKSNYYNSYNINPVITQASMIFQEYLKLNGISSIVETKSVAKVLKENNIAYETSYRGSRILLEDAKENYNTLNYYFDLQMSDYEYDITTVNIDGVNYAKVLFVVGTDNGNYSLNQELANSLNNILEQEKGGISRGVSLRGGEGYQGVYNQDFDKNALLIQVGGKENTIDEVNRSLKILADVINKYILGGNDESK